MILGDGGRSGSIRPLSGTFLTLSGSSRQKKKTGEQLYTARASVGLARLIDCRSRLLADFVAEVGDDDAGRWLDAKLLKRSTVICCVGSGNLLPIRLNRSALTQN